MQDETLYNLSKKLKLISNCSVKLNRSDWYAFHKLVDTSEKGFNCGYAKRLKKMGYEESELKKFKDNLEQIQDALNFIKEAMDEDDEK